MILFSWVVDASPTCMALAPLGAQYCMQLGARFAETPMTFKTYEFMSYEHITAKIRPQTLIHVVHTTCLRRYHMVDQDHNAWGPNPN